MRTLLLALLFAAITCGAYPGVERPAPALPNTTALQLFVWRVYIRDASDVARLTAGPWDVLESRGPDYLRVLGDAAVEQMLTAQGFRVEADQAIPARAVRAPLTYYGGYHTVSEHELHLDAVVAAHTDLAHRVDFGDTWRKLHGLAGGHDLLAICITRLQPGDCEPGPANGKARLLVMAGVHARELAPPELAWRWIDDLVSRYGVDADITALLDANEMWVVPLANPDGRSIVEQGGNSPILQRKNANMSLGSCGIPYLGVDLNRNAGFQWGGANSTNAPCNQFYRGTAADSEPETSALLGLMGDLFPDQRGPAIGDRAPLTSTGIVLSLHSDGNLVMMPWDWTSTYPPNNAELRSLIFRLNAYNGYRAGQSAEVLYLSSGTLEDWAYGQLGVPDITVEIGSSFLPDYGLIDSAYWPLNRGALLYAAWIARQPYAMALGPVAFTPTLSLSTTRAGSMVTLTAWVDDGRYGAAGVGRPVAQVISQAEYSIDLPSWAGGSAVRMDAADGSFNTTREQVSAPIDTRLAAGRHLVYVHGRDASGHWGVPAVTWLDVIPPLSRTIGGAVTDRLTGLPLTATITLTVGSDVSTSLTDPATGRYTLTLAATLPATLTVSAPGYVDEARALGEVWEDRGEDFALLAEGWGTGVYLPFISHGLPPPPQADFDAVPREGPAPLVVTFTNTSSGNYTTSQWDFGDGVTSTFQHPLHVYTWPGAYTVTLAVMGVDGSSTLTRAGSITAGFPAFQWLDATQGGVVLAQGDDTYKALDLPFPFTFYGQAYTRTFVSSNGFLSFGTGYTSYSNGCLPGAGMPNNAIYAFWDDLVPDGGPHGNIYARTIDSDTFAVEWHQVFKLGSTAHETFEIVLSRDGSILLQYQVVQQAESATAGVEDGSGTQAQQLICNGRGMALTDGLAMRFRTDSQILEADTTRQIALHKSSYWRARS